MKHYTLVDYATQAYAALVLLLILFFHNSTVPYWPWFIAAHFGVLLLVHWLIQASSSSDRVPRVLDFLRHFYPVLLYTGFFCETGLLNRMFFSDYLDPTIAQWDQALFGCQPGYVLMQQLPFLPLSELLYAAYFSYYVMIVGVGLALFLRNREQFSHYISVISLVFYVCYLLYIFLPVIGPQAMTDPPPGYEPPEAIRRMIPEGPAYPEAVQAGPFRQLMAWVYSEFEAPGSAIPSSHVAIALCTLYFSFRCLRRIRFVHLSVVVLLCIATVYCHYHYVVDVLTGILTAVVLIPIANRLYARFGNKNT